MESPFLHESGASKTAALLIRDATIICGGGSGYAPRREDVLVVDGRIARIGNDVERPSGCEVIDATDKLLMPGLVNSHLHSGEVMAKARYERLTMEPLGCYAYGHLAGADADKLPSRLRYLMTALAAMESAKNGVTTVLDDVYGFPLIDLAELEETFGAYEDVGIRANVAAHVIDRNFVGGAFADRIPRDLRENRTRALPRATDYFELCREALLRFHNRHGRMRFVVSPSAPERCSDELLLGVEEIAAAHDLTYHIHAQETRMQVVAALEEFGKTPVRRLADLGVMTRRTCLAHAVWVTDKDIDIIAAHGCSVTHAPYTNARLGSGVAPLRKLWNAGIEVGLATDGQTSNESARMFDVMRFGSAIHNVGEPDATAWPSAAEILRAATVGGATNVNLNEQIGSIEVGKEADLVLLNMRTIPFTPLNDPCKHIVNAENGASIELVLVAGRPIVIAGRLTLVDEQQILDELREFASYYQRRQEEVEVATRPYEAFLLGLHQQAMTSQDNPHL